MGLPAFARLCLLCYTKTTLKGLIIAGFVTITVRIKELAEGRFSVRLRLCEPQHAWQTNMIPLDPNAVWVSNLLRVADRAPQ